MWFPIAHMIIIHVRLLRQALQDELPPVWFAIAHMIYMSEFYDRPSRMFLPIWFPIAHRIYMSEFYGRPSRMFLPIWFPIAHRIYLSEFYGRPSRMSCQQILLWRAFSPNKLCRQNTHTHTQLPFPGRACFVHRNSRHQRRSVLDTRVRSHKTGVN